MFQETVMNKKSFKIGSYCCESKSVLFYLFIYLFIIYLFIYLVLYLVS